MFPCQVSLSNEFWAAHPRDVTIMWSRDHASSARRSQCVCLSVRVRICSFSVLSLSVPSSFCYLFCLSLGVCFSLQLHVLTSSNCLCLSRHPPPTVLFLFSSFSFSLSHSPHGHLYSFFSHCLFSIFFAPPLLFWYLSAPVSLLSLFFMLVFLSSAWSFPCVSLSSILVSLFCIFYLPCEKKSRSVSVNFRFLLMIQNFWLRFFLFFSRDVITNESSCGICVVSEPKLSFSKQTFLLEKTRLFERQKHSLWSERYSWNWPRLLEKWRLYVDD